MNVKDIDNLELNWHATVPCQLAYVDKKLAHLGPAICSQYIIVHFVKDGRMHIHTSTLPAKITSYNSV